MDILAQLLLYVGAFALMVIVGTFIFLMMDTTLDVMEEQRQAR